MNGKIIKQSCALATLLHGNTHFHSDFYVIYDLVFDILDIAAGRESMIMGREYHLVDSLEDWLGDSSSSLYAKLAGILNERFCCDITAEECADCHNVKALAKLLDESTGYFFPEWCRYCSGPCFRKFSDTNNSTINELKTLSVIK